MISVISVIEIIIIVVITEIMCHLSSVFLGCGIFLGLLTT